MRKTFSLCLALAGLCFQPNRCLSNQESVEIAWTNTTSDKVSVAFLDAADNLFTGNNNQILANDESTTGYTIVPPPITVYDGTMCEGPSSNYLCAAGIYTAGNFTANLYCSFVSVQWTSENHTNNDLGTVGAVVVTSDPPVMAVTGPYGAVDLSMPWSALANMSNHIYRNTNLSGAYTPVTTTTDTEYTDTGLTPGNTYYYYIESYGPYDTIFTTPTNEVVAGVAAFVAIAESQTNAAYSSDGIHWTNSIDGLPTAGSWTSVAYGEGKYVAVAGNINHAAYSTDGIHWNESNLADGWNSVTYGNGIFVAVNESETVAYSTDGVNWNTSSGAMPSSADWISVTYGDGVFVAVCSEGGTMYDSAYSANGTSWTASAMTVDEKWRGIAYGGGTFAAVATAGGDYGSYSSGITFHSSTFPTTGWDGIAYGDSQFVAVAGAVATTSAAYSSSGDSWSSSTMPSSHTWMGVAYGSGTFVAVAHGTSDGAYSTTGSTWTASTMSSSANWISVAAEQ